MYNFFQKKINEQVPSFSLAIIRVLFFGLILFEIFNNTSHLTTINKTPILSIWTVTLIALILGFKYNFFKWINYVLIVIFATNIIHIDFNAFHFFIGFSTLSLFVPFNASFSMDYVVRRISSSTLKKDITPATDVKAINYDYIFLFGIVFFHLNALFNLYQSDFQNDYFILTALQSNNSISDSLQFPLSILITLTYALSILSVFWIKIRNLLFILILPILISAFITTPNIGSFWIANLILGLCLIPFGRQNKILDFVKRKKENGVKKVVFYYDGECPLCFRTKTIISSFDLFGKIEFKKLQIAYYTDKELQKYELEELYQDVYGVSSINGKLVKGIYTYIEVLNSFYCFKIISLIIRIPPFITLGKLVYKVIASSRDTERCSDKNCALSPRDLANSSQKVKLFKNLSLDDFNQYALFFFTILLLLFILTNNIIALSVDNPSVNYIKYFLDTYISFTPLIK